MTPPAVVTRALADETATLALGAALARGVIEVGPPLTIHLSGELGAGKTTLARGLLRGLGVTGRIKSPSYALVETYKVSIPQKIDRTQNLSLYCYHFDFYRFEHPSEWLEAGFREVFDDRALCLVEWPEKASGDAGDALPAPDIRIELRASADGVARVATLHAFTARGAHCLAAAAF